MSDANGLWVSIKDYANQRGKTVQAVYQQMKRKENVNALAGHVHVKRVGNKDVKFLDEVAVSLLDEASHSTPIVIQQDDLKNALEQTSQDLELAQKKLLYQEGQIQTLKELLADRERELRQLAEPERQISSLTAENGVLRADVELLSETLEKERIASQKLSGELSGENKKLEDENHLLKNELEAEKNRKLTFVERLFGRKIRGKKNESTGIFEN